MKEIILAIFAIWVAYNLWRVFKSPDNAVEVGADSVTNAPLSAAFAEYMKVGEYYLELSPGHRRYEIAEVSPTGDIVIDVWETAGFQFVKHKYRIAELVENERMKLVSEHSRVRVLWLFSGQNRSETTFRFEAIDEFRTRLFLTIRIVFPSSFSLLLAHMFFTRSIWQRHARQEMNALAEIIAKRYAAAQNNNKSP